jgi:hypothetical protein
MSNVTAWLGCFKSASKDDYTKCGTFGGLPRDILGCMFAFSQLVAIWANEVMSVPL